jgi:hypothetical protein
LKYLERLGIGLLCQKGNRAARIYRRSCNTFIQSFLAFGKNDDGALL